MTHCMPGNTGIQLAVAYILAKRFSIETLELYDSTKEYGDTVTCTEEMWENVHPFLHEDAVPFFFPIGVGNIGLNGYYQNSVPLVRHRDMLLEAFPASEHVVSSGGTTLKEFMLAASPIALCPEDIVLHVRLGDFVGANLVIYPAPQLALLRRLQPKRLVIVCAAPRNAAEENYLRLFEEFHPVFQHGTELEDFAVLRSANRLMITNSTFSWLAGFVGNATERWIPVPTYNALGRIADTDILYEAKNGYDISGLAIPTTPFAPVTGEFLQSLCDYTVLDREIHGHFGKAINEIVDPKRQLFIEEEWPSPVLSAVSLFVYPTENYSVARHVFARTWPRLRLLVFHNSDYDVDYKGLTPFLERHPEVYVWAQNVTRPHPRLRSVPICEENRMWRNGRETVTASRSKERDIEILLPYWSGTHRVRSVWREQAVGRPDVTSSPRLEKEVYLDTVTHARALVCPPGNGIDTHRCWDALTKGAWAIVEDNAHTQILLDQYPSLHLIPVVDMTDDIQIPAGLPPFHPVLLRAFWETLFLSYVT